MVVLKGPQTAPPVSAHVDVNSEHIAAQLAGLRRMYTQKLQAKVTEILGGWEKVHSNDWQGADVHAVLFNVHKLTGSAGTFGFHDVSTAGRALEEALASVVNTTDAPDAAARQRVALLVTRLSDVVTRSLAHPHPEEAAPSVASVSPRHHEHSRLIFLVEDDSDVARELALQTSYFGYEVRSFERVDDMLAVAANTNPAAIIMDVMFPEGKLAGTDAVESLQSSRDTPLPVLFISARDDIQARLQAVRAGGQGYFLKPVNFGLLIDRLDEITKNFVPDPYRILIVDDDQELAHAHALMLNQASLVTEEVNDPLEVMHPLREFRPDLILMDLNMEGCGGMELTQVIRQHESHIAIPIIFLSTDTNLDNHFNAVDKGGDTFLSKPIRPEHLVSTVKTRAKRARMLRSYMVRDSLTGLLNHRVLNEHLEIEVSRARRIGSELSYAMIDIDHFKAVNDNHGHAAGDRVIKSASRLFQERLRRTDIVGRYGGEEFAIIFPHTPVEQAFAVIEEVRERFSRVKHQSDASDFSVTFSAGVTNLATHADAKSLSLAADRALYAAKSQGRNKTILGDTIAR